MKARLLKANRIDGTAGEIVEVSPARFRYLVGLKLATPAETGEQAKPAKKTEAKKPAAKKTAAKGKK